ncbi:hypothetical protein PHMEG_0006607 [Phytophthora megakarya]|uniref:Secreted protein n=1 Tax=Phytophthora megakarya TaxID=4795 RepID=A0A225WNH8_9STRA|nr:hypothetical protein PHMEG_0006607 [Phytophthora megakarya]
MKYLFMLVLLNMLKQRQTSLFGDGIFRCVPSKFKQWMVFPTYDRPTKSFIQSIFIFCTSIKYDMYFQATRLFLDATDQAMQPQYS